MQQFDTARMQAARDLLGLGPVRKGGTPPPKGDLSSTRASKFESCRKAYKFEYVDKLKPFPGRRGIRGSVTHKTLEAVAKRRLLGENLGPVTWDEVEREFEFRCGRQPLTAAEVSSTKSMLQSCIARLDLSNMVGIEEEIRLDIGGDSVVGVIDRLDVTTDGTVEIWDYKTGDDIPTRQEAEEDFQVGIYLTRLREMAKDAPRILFKLWYMGHDLVITVGWNPDLDFATRARLRSALDGIRSETDFRANTGTHCIRCPFREMCDEFKALRKSDGSVVSIADKGDAELLREYDRARKLEKIFEEHKRECANALRVRLAEKNSVVGAGLKATLIQKNGTKPPSLGPFIQELSKRTGQAPEEIAGLIGKVDPKAFQRYVAGLPETLRKTVQDLFDEYSEEYLSTVYPDVRTVGRW